MWLVGDAFCAVRRHYRFRTLSLGGCFYDYLVPLIIPPPPPPRRPKTSLVPSVLKLFPRSPSCPSFLLPSLNPSILPYVFCVRALQGLDPGALLVQFLRSLLPSFRPSFLPYFTHSFLPSFLASFLPRSLQRPSCLLFFKYSFVSFLSFVSPSPIQSLSPLSVSVIP